MDVKKIITRALSGAVYIAIVVGLILSGIYGVWALAALFCVMATIEFDRICFYPEHKNIVILACDIVLNLAALFIIGPYWMFTLPLFIGLLMLRFIAEISLTDPSPLKSLSSSLMSTVYIAWPMAVLCYMATRLDTFEPAYSFKMLPILFIFVLIWLNDTGAFLVGCTIGKHHMSPKISPKKTWEGFFGGMAFTIGGALGAYQLFDGCLIGVTPLLLWVWILFGVVVTLFATWGDLLESLIKRNLGLKDSGNIMPGHGGILDRIDSLLMVIPVSFILFLYALLNHSAC